MVRRAAPSGGGLVAEEGRHAAGVVGDHRCVGGQQRHLHNGCSGRGPRGPALQARAPAVQTEDQPRQIAPASPGSEELRMVRDVCGGGPEPGDCGQQDGRALPDSGSRFTGRSKVRRRGSHLHQGVGDIRRGQASSSGLVVRPQPLSPFPSRCPSYAHGGPLSLETHGIWAQIWKFFSTQAVLYHSWDSTVNGVQRYLRGL